MITIFTSINYLYLNALVSDLLLVSVNSQRPGISNIKVLKGLNILHSQDKTEEIHITHH